MFRVAMATQKRTWIVELPNHGQSSALKKRVGTDDKSLDNHSVLPPARRESHGLRWFCFLTVYPCTEGPREYTDYHTLVWIQTTTH